MQENPAASPCETCHCRPGGKQSYDRWVIENVMGETWRSSICPRQLITPRSELLLTLYQHYRNGNLAAAGGILAQPNVYLEAMRVISNRTELIRAERAKPRA